VLNVAAVGAGLGLVYGLATIWVQNIKDITVAHAGAPMRDQGDRRSGLQRTRAVTDDLQLSRPLTQPSSVDVNNIDSAKLPYLVGKGVGKLSLVEIALNARFSSQASFTRAFRRAIGVTPGEYSRGRR
jgi:AraC-like DNA-binding protein